jgi:hypothetical protein
MPSGYTALLQDKPDTTFEQFAARCARAMGALIHMRDDPSDAPLPEKIKPSPWHADQIVQHEAELTNLRMIPVAARQSAADKEWEATEKRRVERIARRTLTRITYEAMLERVRAWVPPTPDHQGFKDFMEKQLVESIAWDCDNTYENEPAQRLSGQEWYDKREAYLLKEIQRSKEDHAKELARTEERQAWLDALRASLTPPDRPTGTEGAW